MQLRTQHMARIASLAVLTVVLAVPLAVGAASAQATAAPHHAPAGSRHSSLLASGAAITITPNSNVKSGQKVSVSGSGFPASKTAYVTECANPPGASTCDASSNVQVQTGANGSFSGVMVTVVTGTWGGKSCAPGGSCLITATTDPTGADPTQSAQGTFTFAASQQVTKVKTKIFAGATLTHHKVKLQGAVEDKNGDGLAGLKLKVSERAKGSKKWHKVASTRSHKNGAFAVKGLKHFAHKEQYRVSHSSQKIGTTIYKASASKPVTVK